MDAINGKGQTTSNSVRVEHVRFLPAPSHEARHYVTDNCRSC